LTISGNPPTRLATTGTPADNRQQDTRAESLTVRDVDEQPGVFEIEFEIS
jgi:hypothetical protein